MTKMESAADKSHFQAIPLGSTSNYDTDRHTKES